MPYYVSRQIRWPDGEYLVEIVSPGRDHSSPGEIGGGKYHRLGEGEEFKDPREAVEAAIAVCEAWRKDVGEDDPEPQLAGYSTGGGMWVTSEVTFEDARAWAEEVWEKLPKCDGCGNPLPDKGKRYRADDWSGREFCSESCADQEREWQEKWEAEQAAEEEERDAS